MGYLTTVLLHNDALNVFKDHPEEFGKSIINAASNAFDKDRQIVPFYGYSNYIDVFRSRHVSDPTIYIMYGNDLIDINSEEFENWMKNNPKMASLYIKIAEQELAFVKSKFAKLT